MQPVQTSTCWFSNFIGLVLVCNVRCSVDVCVRVRFASLFGYIVILFCQHLIGLGGTKQSGRSVVATPDYSVRKLMFVCVCALMHVYVIDRVLSVFAFENRKNVIKKKKIYGRESKRDNLNVTLRLV